MNANLRTVSQFEKAVEVTDAEVLVRELLIESRDVAQYLGSTDEDHRPTVLIHALEVGVHCLEYASHSRSVDLVRSQIAALLADVERAVEQIPETVETGLVSRIGVEDGQVLAPVRIILSDVRAASSERVREVQTLLAEEIDPSRETSTLGKALRRLNDLLDPRRTDSVQASVSSAVQAVSAADGMLADVVKKTVSDAVTPLAIEVGRLALELRGQEAVEEALGATTAKGATYETTVLRLVSDWARHVGAQVTHVGSDNRPGDVLVELDDSAGERFRVVIEARGRRSALGRKGIAECVERAICERECDAAVYVSQTAEGFTNEIGEWAEGTTESGNFIATTSEHLLTAVRFLLVLRRISQLKQDHRELDEAALHSQLARIKTALTRITTIKRRVTDVRTSADGIESEAESLRGEIRGALLTLEDVLALSSAA